LPVIENVRVGAHFGAHTHGAKNEENHIKEVIDLVGLREKETVVAARVIRGVLGYITEENVVKLG
jgi:hypothetical protein